MLQKRDFLTEMFHFYSNFYLKVLLQVELPVERFCTMPAAAVWKIISAPSFR